MPFQPDIPKRGESKSPADFISYTVSAPSGRATALFSTEGKLSNMTFFT